MHEGRMIGKDGYQFFKSLSSIKGGDIIGEKVNGEDTQRTTLREEEKKASQERVEYDLRE